MSVNLIIVLLVILVAWGSSDEESNERKAWLAGLTFVASLFMTSFLWLAAVLFGIQICWNKSLRADQISWGAIILLVALVGVGRVVRPYVVSEVAATATKLEYRNSSVLRSEDMKFVRAQASDGMVHLVVQERVPDLMSSIMIGLTLGKDEETFKQVMHGFVNKTFCDGWARWFGVESRFILLNLGHPIYQAEIDTICQ